MVYASYDMTVYKGEKSVKDEEEVDEGMIYLLLILKLQEFLIEKYASRQKILT